MLRFGITPLAALASALAASWIARRFRRTSVAALILSFLIPSLLQMIRVLPEGWDGIGGGVRISDLILVGMWGASAAWMVGRRDVTRAERLFLTVSLALVAVMLVAVVRNWGVYGLSAFGEFRSRYLIIGLPVYLALGLDSPAIRSWLAKLLAGAPIIGVLLGLPLVASVFGWGFGAATRFYPSSVSLAILLASMFIYLSDSRYQSSPRILLYGVYALVGFVLIKDAHRSVWLVAAVCLALLVNQREVKIARALPWVLGTLLTVVVAILAARSLGTETLAYLVERAGAFLNPAGDRSSYWRLSVWGAYVQPFLQSPLLGHGFGGYWEAYVPELGGRVVTSPHSMYVQTLVKTGLIGLGVLLGWFVSVFRALSSGLREQRISGTSRAVLMLGLLGVAASLAYGSVYPLDLWPLAWIGLALAELFRGKAGDGQ
ncbi:MAG: O-antigen ligase family protein [Coriobacteriia bacterium]|nr:O-antigen ligase family protein [Coriobacteriia bacterium]